MGCYIRVSAIFEDGTSVDNDKVEVSGKSDTEMQVAIDREIASAKAWFSDREPKEYMVSVYNGDRCIYAYATER